MDVQDRLQKLRQERFAREKARIEKLKELNLKKYNRDDSKMPFLSNVSMTNNKSTIKYSSSSSSVTSINKTTINSKHTVRQSTVAVLPTKPKLNIVKKEINETDSIKKFKIQHRVVAEIPKMEANRCINKILPKPNVVKRNIIQENIANASKTIEIKHNGHMGKNQKVPCKIMPPPKNEGSTKFESKTFNNRDEANKISEVPVNKRRETVFDRLYKPKSAPKERVTNAQKIKNDTAFRNKILKNAGLLVNSRKTMFEPTEMKITEPTIRRSISAIHLKKLSKSELPHCIHKWSSIGEKLNKIHLAELNEDLNVRKQNESAVKSDRKKSVRFQKGIALNLNAPTGEELQIRLKNWLQKRGKSMDSYHHLQCFGLHHLAQSQKDVLSFKDYDEEDKENVEQADGDNNSFTDNLSDRKDDFGKWRRESCFSDSMNMTKESSLHSEEMPVHYVDELLLGALNDLSELLREGFDWEQCARWLRALRERFPSAPNTAAYWECRAALEESQGNFPASVECWEQAIAKGTERTVVEASLDQLLDKFMQLKISPNAGRRVVNNQKLVDVKNVFKSTVIKFAVQQAKLKQSEAKYVATPVRRSSRLFNGKPTPMSNKKRTPLVQLCSSMRQIDEEYKSNLLFVPNKTLEFTP